MGDGNEITIGKNIQTNTNLTINLPKLIDTRLLVQANSGSGKSWLLRKILEETHGKVQQIVLDLEGEFATLREKYDYVLIDDKFFARLKTFPDKHLAAFTFDKFVHPVDKIVV